MPRITITELASKLPDEDAAYAYLEKLHWPNQPVCPHCGSINDHYFLTPKGEGRKTRTGSISARRVWKCKDCRKQFSVTTGTIFHGTRVSLRIWIFVLFEMAANKNGLAAREVARKYGLPPKTAWLMTQKIRAAMGNRAPHMMTGTFVADETWIGGDPMNDHHRKPEVEPVRFEPGSKRPHQRTAKTPVLCLINADTHESHTTMVTDVTGDTLREHIANHVHMDSSVLMTDESTSYGRFSSEWLRHETVNHSVGEYVRWEVRPWGSVLQHGRELLFSAQAVTGWNPPLHQQGAHEPLPGRIRFPLLNLQGRRHRADANAGESDRWAAGELQKDQAGLAPSKAESPGHKAGAFDQTLTPVGRRAAGQAKSSVVDFLAPKEGLEPSTHRLTGGCSAN